MNNSKNILDLSKMTHEKNGVWYFTKIPKDAIPSRDVEPQDESKWSFWRKENFKFFSEELGKLRSDSVLVDLGAGQSDFGKLTERFRKRYAADFYPYEGINVVCDLNKSFPFKAGLVDVILLSNVLEHIKEPNLFLEECARILKPNGVMLGSVPFLINVHQRPYDFYRYTDMNLEYILKKSGFSRAEIKPVLKLDALIFAHSARFFTDLIKKSGLSGIQTAFLRVLWRAIRAGFYVLSPLFARAYQNPEYPLGYLFKAGK